MKPNRITASRPADFSKTQLVDLIVGGEGRPTNRTFHFGQVIDSNDPENANRLRIRIPLLDDVFYGDSQGKPIPKVGDDSLPWAISANGRTIDTPENGAVVLVALFDPQSPFTGRIWFTAPPELSRKEIFDADRLEPELQSDAWDNAEKNVEVKFNNSPEVRGRPGIASKRGKTNYQTGLRGKDRNKLMFDKAKTTLIQNEGRRNKESKLELTEDVLLSGGKLDLISRQSSKRHTPLFADPMFDYLTQLNGVVTGITTILSTIPSLWMASIPNAPNPAATGLVSAQQAVVQRLTNLRVKGVGHSKYIQIN